MGDCVTPATVSNFANKDTNRLVGKIGRVLARKSPWMDVLEGGTLSNVSDVVRSVVQERAVIAASLANPVFTNDVDLCGVTGGRDQVGSTEYTYQLQSLRGEGPRVCVKTSRTAFQGSYRAAQESLEKGILQINNADIRATMYNRSGCKFVARNDMAFSQLLTGDMQQIDTDFANLIPNGPMSFKALYKLGVFLREEMLAEAFESDRGTMFKVLGSPELIETFRNELDVKEDLLSLVKGRYTIGEKSIDGYMFQGPYRGFAFGVDSQPLRFNSVDADGQPILIEPEISTVVTKGVGARRNPTWVSALYEVGFLIAQESFARLVPESYTGEGTFRFNPQLAMGELKWHYVVDNDCNKYGDYGHHIYQISRAYQPIRPHAVIPFIYQRCRADLGIGSCNSSISGL